MLKFIPEAKQICEFEGYCDASSLNWSFAEGTDPRVISAAQRICAVGSGTAVSISHGTSDKESYTLDISADSISIEAPGAAGAFYALMTLKMLLKTEGKKLACCKISDSPDMEYRGFYQDTTRGRIPTLETLKALADRMAECKMNSLQLYVEHSYEFREYEFCREELGCLTKAEIKELDAYCHERFIELVPSLSSFGHLYHLLQNDKYKHLCELKDFTPTRHHFIERMAHHTINPLLDESFELITSLMDQHMEAFTSNKFNICCDETFDLGRDVNSDKDKAELYVTFVKKLVAYLESKGKTVMMWGDIALKHPEKIAEFPEKIIFLNWYYNPGVEETRFKALSVREQMVCPGTSAWRGFHELIDLEEGNITEMVRFGQRYGARGILNTNWGDIGNPASISMAAYGLMLGAAEGWNNDTAPNDELRSFVAEYAYGCSDALNILSELSTVAPNACWLAHSWGWPYADDSAPAFEHAQSVITNVIEKIKSTNFADPNIKELFLLSAEGDSLVCEWSAALKGHSAPSKVNFESWLKRFEACWLNDSKVSELYELMRLFTAENAKSRGEAK